jgi:hypothetical protein
MEGAVHLPSVISMKVILYLNLWLAFIIGIMKIKLINKQIQTKMAQRNARLSLFKLEYYQYNHWPFKYTMSQLCSSIPLLFIDHKVIWIIYSWRCDDVNLGQASPISTHFSLFNDSDLCSYAVFAIIAVTVMTIITSRVNRPHTCLHGSSAYTGFILGSSKKLKIKKKTPPPLICEIKRTITNFFFMWPYGASLRLRHVPAWS